MSKLYFRYGAMSSGKSLDLIKVYFNYRERDMDVLVMKPFIDTKGENRVTSRNGSDIVCDFLIKSNDNIFDEKTAAIVQEIDSINTRIKELEANLDK